MRSPFARRSRRAPARLGLDLLENRRLLAITPGNVYDSTATWTDADGDTVTVSLTGTVGAGAGFTVELAGIATDNADATRITLTGLTEDNGLQVVVTPNQLTAQPGTSFATMYSPGYTNVAFLDAEAGMTGLGGVQLSAAVVNSISLAGIDIGSITLDAGQAPLIDRINTQNNQQAADTTMYNPVTGLIDLGGIQAKSIDSLVINGAISAPTKNPYDTSVTNDFRSVINVSGRIGSVVGLRSSLSGAIRADSIGSVRVANIAGEITTRNSEEDFAINLPAAFKGFINSAGHLHLGFPLSDGSLITGQITAGGGISGSDKDSQLDTLYLPGGYVGSLTNTSALTGIADIAIDGEGALGISSAASVGSISADGFTGDFVVEAATSIGNVEAGSGSFEGHLLAGGDIGAIKAVRSILATIIAGGDIASLMTIEGSMESLSIQSGGDIGPMYFGSGILGTSFQATRDIGHVIVPVGGVQLAYLAAGRDIAGVAVRDGSIENVSVVAGRDIGPISAFGSIARFGISDTSIVAGRTVADVTARSHTGSAIDALKVEAGEAITNVVGTSYGEFGALAGAGIIDSNFVAGAIGGVIGTSAGGTGIESTKIVSRQAGIGAVSGFGWLDGLAELTVVAQTSIGPITGIASLDGSGIKGGTFDALYGSIGQITAEGGAAGGHGIESTRFQATDLDEEEVGNGRIAGITASANANGRNALTDVVVYAGSIGAISATVHGGLDGNGILEGEIRAFSGGIDSITVDVRSINGIGIFDGKVQASGDIGGMTVKAFNATAIQEGTFQSRGNFGAIYAEATKGGNAIDGAVFTAPGRIVLLDPANPPPDTDAFDPKGNFGTITAVAGGTNAQASAIVDSTFTAIGDIGLVTATSRGANAIVRSTFTADSDGDYTPQQLGSPRPWLASGNLAGIAAVAAGRNLAASSAIVDSTFTAANIGDVYADVQTVEGGNAIFGSTFTARTAVYDGRGNFDNTGTIGDVLVRNRSSAQPGLGTGIENTAFVAGSAGAIGDITVTTSGASGIFASSFFANVVDLDQNAYTSTIGNITVNTGRALTWTIVPVAITGSSFIAAAGIGNVTVDSIGSGITASTFIADFDYLSFTGDPGVLGDITVKVPGRNASGITGSVFSGSSIGDVTVRLTADAEQGINAIALSAFTAWTGTIGNVTVIHSQTGFLYNVGLGYAVLTSVFNAFAGIGAITIQGRTLGAVFIVSGQPVVLAASAAVQPAGSSPTTIGPVSISMANSTELTLDAAGGSIGPLSFTNLASGTMITLALAASSVGNVSVSSPGGLSTADLSLSGTVSTLGALTVDGNATLDVPSITTMGNLSVGGTLTLPRGLPSLAQMGTFTAGALPGLARDVSIGSRSLRGTSIGAIEIGSINRTKQQKGLYNFAFSTYAGSPNAIVAGKGRNATSGGATVEAVRLFRTAAAQPAPTTTPTKRKRR